MLIHCSILPLTLPSLLFSLSHLISFLHSIAALSRLMRCVQAHTDICDESRQLLGILQHIKAAKRLPSARPRVPLYSIEVLEL